ncbi:MAG TPA: GDP-mannose 4,6-dehydratase, partial [Chloroflexota bacterium]|nr:GDP-mannose 4,6-dehydratase [Chloroflexota bacterium]
AARVELQGPPSGNPPGNRYGYADYPYGIPESYPLDFHSPYGCSKGTGDQYMLDYARIYGLRTLVFRQSCIYGRRQFGVEDQGWVAHFVIAAVLNRPINIYGDGRQVRDLLHVSDLIRAYERGIERMDELKGQALNIGGGPQNTLSIWSEFGPLLAELSGHEIPVQWGDWRPGDQRVFIADIRKASQRLGWQPTISPAAGIRDLYTWVASNPTLF